MTQYVRCALGLLITGALSACGTAPRGAAELPLYTGPVLDSYQLVVANPESQQVFTGQALSVPKPPGSNMTDQAVSAEAATKDAPNDAVTLRWKDIWYAGLRVEGGKALDLTPYLDKGTLEFDLRVNELAKGGLTFKVDCGKDCERKVSHVVQAREAAGKGWRHLSYSMKCFVRDGDNFSAVTKPFAVDGTGNGDISIANIVMNKTGTPNTSCPDYKTVSVTPG